MARTLDTTKPYGWITPPHKGARFEQGGRYFDALKNEIDIDGSMAAATEAESEAMKAQELLNQAETLPFFKFKSEAKKTLGFDELPAKKDEIIELLQRLAQVKEPDIPSDPAPSGDVSPSTAPEGGAESAAAGMTWGDTPEGEAVDLVGWVTGQKQYLFADIQKAFREQHSFNAFSEVVAVQFMIENGLIDKDAVAPNLTGEQGSGSVLG